MKTFSRQLKCGELPNLTRNNDKTNTERIMRIEHFSAAKVRFEIEINSYFQRPISPETILFPSCIRKKIEFSLNSNKQSKQV